jgi:hypothetical protein
MSPPNMYRSETHLYKKNIFDGLAFKDVFIKIQINIKCNL